MCSLTASDGRARVTKTARSKDWSASLRRDFLVTIPPATNFANYAFFDQLENPINAGVKVLIAAEQKYTIRDRRPCVMFARIHTLTCTSAAPD
jgi:hypothetical protein